MSFIVNQHGIVLQKDPGPETTSVAAGIKLYDPDLSWSRGDIANQRGGRLTSNIA